WAENHPLAGRLKFSEYMIMPVQRITRYHILVENISQFTDDDFKREKFTLIKEIVNSLPNRINVKLGYLAQFNDISDSIEKYEGVQGQNDEVNEILSQFKKFDIKSALPGCAKTSVRELIHQGPLRLKDVPKSVDVHCFLFTDMLLITQLKKSKKYKIIKPPMQTNRMIVKELSQSDKAFICISLNDYNVPDSVYMFISNQCKKWIEFLDLAKQKYLSERQKLATSATTTMCTSLSAESDESDTDRRNSSATLTENPSEATITQGAISPHTEPKAPAKHTSGTRIFGGRLDRPRRNMTDPNQHCGQDKHAIAKRNSLNERPAAIKPSLVNQTRMNFFADSTSTILSTDSGVSNCDHNQISFSQESIGKHSPAKMIAKNTSPSSPTASSYSSTSNEPIYSNLSMSSSSSSNCSKYDTIKSFKPLDEDFYEDEDIADETSATELNASACDSNFMFKKIPNFRVKQPSSENIKLIRANFESVEAKVSDAKGESGGRVSVRKPLVRIRPTNFRNEAARVSSQNVFGSNFDSSVDSAQQSVNGVTLDQHHRMILVNLLHTTLDST
ncbi:pleckstrin homology domain-containing family G member 5-like isoform X1, partial [Brachionus plicatilis]